MSIAYHINLVEVYQVQGGLGVGAGSCWRTGNLLFLAAEAAQEARLGLEAWALAQDSQGRAYLIWHADHPRVQGLVIQPLHSRYCFELTPA